MQQLTNIDLAEEAKYAEYMQLAHELQMPAPSAFIEIEVTNAIGERISYDRRRSHTWKRNAYNELVSQGCSCDIDDSSFGAGFLSMRTTANNVRYGNAGALVFTVYASASETAYGIVVGTNNSAEDFEGYRIVAQVSHGENAGELWYLGTSMNHAWVGGPLTYTTTVRRHWQNRSPGVITIREAAIYARMYVGGTARNVMICRDVLSPERAIASGSQLRVDYDIVLTYPE